MLAPLFSLAATALAGSVTLSIEADHDSDLNGKGISYSSVNDFFFVFTVSDDLTSVGCDDLEKTLQISTNWGWGSSNKLDLFQAPAFGGLVLASPSAFSNKLTVDNQKYVSINGTSDCFYACSGQNLLFNPLPLIGATSPCIVALPSGLSIDGCESIKIKAEWN